MHRWTRFRPILLTLACLTTQGAGCTELAPPRLAGVVIGPSRREAIFAERGGAYSTVNVGEGAEVDGYSVQSIALDTVTLLGPGGEQTVYVTSGADQPAPQPPAAGMAADPGSMPAQPTDASVSVWQLSLARDRCARSGLVAAVPAQAEVRLQQVVAAMARPGAEGEAAALSTQLAAVLGPGLEAAGRQGADGELDAADCVRIDTAWERAAGQFDVQ